MNVGTNLKDIDTKLEGVYSEIEQCKPKTLWIKTVDVVIYWILDISEDILISLSHDNFTYLSIIQRRDFSNLVERNGLF